MPILSHIEQFLQFTFIRNNSAQNNTMYIKFFYGGYQYHNPHNDTLTRYSLYAPFQLFSASNRRAIIIISRLTKSAFEKIKVTL